MNESAKKRLLIVVIVLAVLTVGLISLVTYRILVAARGSAFDFYTLWYGGRVFWAGEDPYSLETARAIQRAVFGHELPAAANQQGFAYPAYAVVMLAPFLALPFPVAVSIWSALQLVGIALAVALTLDGVGWLPRPVWMGLLVLAAYTFRYAGIVYVIGQTSVAVWLAVAGAVTLYRRGHDAWAGLCLALAALRPELGGPVGLALTVLSLSERRPRLVIGWLGWLAALSLPAFIRRPTWPLDFLAGATAYAGYAPVLWPPALFAPWGWLAGIAVAAAAVYSFWRARREADHRPALVVAALLPLVLVAVPQTGSYTLTLALFTALVAVRPGAGPGARGLAAVLVLAPWAIWALHQKQGTPLAIEQVIVPLLAALTLAISLNPHRRAAPERTGHTH
jgi:hypothetical protein